MKTVWGLDCVEAIILGGIAVTPAETMKIQAAICIVPVKNAAACTQPYLEMGGWDAG